MSAVEVHATDGTVHQITRNDVLTINLGSIYADRSGKPDADGYYPCKFTESTILLFDATVILMEPAEGSRVFGLLYPELRKA